MRNATSKPAPAATRKGTTPNAGGGRSADPERKRSPATPQLQKAPGGQGSGPAGAVWPAGIPHCLMPGHVDFSRLTDAQRVHLEALGWDRHSYSNHVDYHGRPVPFAVAPLSRDAAEAVALGLPVRETVLAVAVAHTGKTPGPVVLDVRAGQSLYDAFIESGLTSTDYSAWVRGREEKTRAVGGVKALHHIAPDVPPLGHQTAVPLPLPLDLQNALLAFRTSDADLASCVVTECYNRGIFVLPDFTSAVYTDGTAAPTQIRLQMLCSEAARRVVVQGAVRFRFTVYLNRKTGPRDTRIVANYDDPQHARQWAKYLRKRPDLAPWFADRTHNREGYLRPEVKA